MVVFKSWKIAMVEIQKNPSKIWIEKSGTPKLYAIYLVSTSKIIKKSMALEP
jgi:hypothetical protein